MPLAVMAPAITASGPTERSRSLASLAIASLAAAVAVVVGGFLTDYGGSGKG